MSDTQPSPGAVQESGEQKSGHGIWGILSKPWWAGVGVLVAVVALVIPLWQANHHSPPRAPAEAVRFTDLAEVTLHNEGVDLYYPADWDLQGGLDAHPIESRQGPKYVNPNDSAVSVEVVGTLSSGGPAGPALEFFPREPTTSDVEKLATSGLSGPGAGPGIRIIDSSESGEIEVDGSQRYPVDAWRVIYQLTDSQTKRSVTVITKTAIADGRAVELIMEAPTSEFPRYEEAFLELSGKMLLLTKCFICFTQ